MNLRIGVFVTAVTAVFFVSVSAADDPVVRELTAAESAVVESITQSSVLGTVGFLASDEMAGRDTPSPELTIASAYVAARFRAAGLEGLGPDGSFFQTHEYSQSVPPANPGSLSVQGRDVRLLDALIGAVD
ncbi:MAG: aminopeptidase, partial [Planctomycetaceae bacterium]